MEQVSQPYSRIDNTVNSTLQSERDVAPAPQVANLRRSDMIVRHPVVTSSPIPQAPLQLLK